MAQIVRIALDAMGGDFAPQNPIGGVKLALETLPQLTKIFLVGIPEAIEKEKAIYRAQMENSGKPAAVLEKIIEGKLGSFYSQFVLLEQPSIRDGSLTISQIVAQATAKTGENIQISRFVRFRVGEGNE